MNGPGDLTPFGQLLHDAWLAKRGLSDKVSNSEFEYSGTQIIFFEQEEDFAKHDKARSRRRLEAFRELEQVPAFTPADKATLGRQRE